MREDSNNMRKSYTRQESSGFSRGEEVNERKPWVISVPPVKCPDDMTGIPDVYIQAWKKYVGKVEPQGGDREDWIETCSRLYWGVRNLGEDAIVRVHGKTDIDPKQLIGLPHFGPVLDMSPIDQYADPSHADRYAINSNVRMLHASVDETQFHLRG